MQRMPYLVVIKMIQLNYIDFLTKICFMFPLSSSMIFVLIWYICLYDNSKIYYHFYYFIFSIIHEITCCRCNESSECYQKVSTTIYVAFTFSSSVLYWLNIRQMRISAYVQWNDKNRFATLLRSNKLMFSRNSILIT